jgi:hypothetical protein
MYDKLQYYNSKLTVNINIFTLNTKRKLVIAKKHNLFSGEYLIPLCPK